MCVKYATMKIVMLMLSKDKIITLSNTNALVLPLIYVFKYDILGPHIHTQMYCVSTRFVVFTTLAENLVYSLLCLQRIMANRATS